VVLWWIKCKKMKTYVYTYIYSQQLAHTATPQPRRDREGASRPLPPQRAFRISYPTRIRHRLFEVFICSRLFGR